MSPCWIACYHARTAAARILRSVPPWRRSRSSYSSTAGASPRRRRRLASASQGSLNRWTAQLDGIDGVDEVAEHAGPPDSRELKGIAHEHQTPDALLGQLEQLGEPLGRHHRRFVEVVRRPVEGVFDQELVDPVRVHAAVDREDLGRGGRRSDAEDRPAFASAGGFIRKQEQFNRMHADEPLPRLTLHGLRHTWATLALHEGIDIKVVSDRLNHSSTFVTREIYTHLTPPMQSDAAERLAARIFGRPTGSP